MAERFHAPVPALIGFVVSLVLPLVVAGIGVDEPWWAVGLSALLGALCLWNLNDAYRKWINDDQVGWIAPVWLKRNLTIAAVGVVAVWLAALLMRWASAQNEQIAVAYALGFWLAGMVPVVQVVRARLVEITDIPELAGAWALNVLFIVVSTIVPALLISGLERSGLLVGGIAAGIWLLFEFSGWIIGRWAWIPVVGGLAMVLPLALIAFGPADAVSLKVLMLFPVGLAFVSARQRSADRKPLLVGSLDAGDVRSWLPLGVLGLVAIAAGTIVWAVVIGDDVSGTVVFFGAIGAIAFGVSLITRGEGLLMVVLLGMLMVWVVQDHTGDPAPLAEPDSLSVLAAFGDSYLSGEGIGSFYADTNEAGSDDLAIDGRNECRRSEFAYSPLVAQARDLDLAFYGCSGALATSGGFDAAAASDLAAAEDDEAEVNSVYGQLLRWERERGTETEPELVLLSLGGNDAGFAKIGAACFLPGSCDNALDTSATPALEGVTARVETAIAKARSLFPTARMVVVAYPQMFGPAIDECGGQVPFNGTETRALQNFVAALNRAVGTGIDNAGGGQVVHFTGAADAYVGERFCELGADGGLVEPAAIRSLAFQPTEGEDLFDRLVPAKIIHNTFHPTKRGHELMTSALLDFLAAGCHEAPDGPDCRAGTEPVAAPPPTPDGSAPQGLIDPSLEAGAVELEVVADAPVGGCNDLATFNRCTIIQSLRLVLAPLVLLVLGGLAGAWAVKQSNLIGWALNRLGVLGGAAQLTPLRDKVERGPTPPDPTR